MSWTRRKAPPTVGLVATPASTPQSLDVLVVGATGLLGAPVARRLLVDGHRVRVLARDPGAARARLGEAFAYLPGSVTDPAAVERAIAGMDAVHISLGATRRGDLRAVEQDGTALLAAAAARHGLRRISYLTGSLVREDYGPKIAEHAAKLAAEQAIQASGVPYTFFRPTYFIDNLPRHRQGGAVVLLGRQRRLLHPVTADDYAGMVAQALVLPEAANRDFFIHGPEPMLLGEAMRMYAASLAAHPRVVTVPLPAMRLVDRLFLRGALSLQLDIMGLLGRLGERGDPEPANALLGRPTTTARVWCQQQTAPAGPPRNTDG